MCECVCACECSIACHLYLLKYIGKALAAVNKVIFCYHSLNICYHVSQLLVSVWDAGNPTVKVSTSVTLVALRNEYAPVFTSSSYSASINDYDPVGTNVTRVAARDQDLPVLIITLLMAVR